MFFFMFLFIILDVWYSLYVSTFYFHIHTHVYLCIYLCICLDIYYFIICMAYMFNSIYTWYRISHWIGLSQTTTIFHGKICKDRLVSCRLSANPVGKKHGFHNQSCIDGWVIHRFYGRRIMNNYGKYGS